MAREIFECLWLGGWSRVEEVPGFALAALPTRYYLPHADVKPGILKASEFTTRCPYKGNASYHNVELNGKISPNLVWYYPTPIPKCTKIDDLVCFFNEKVDEIRIDGKAMPKPQSKWS